MKLRRHPYSYGGQPLAADQFAFTQRGGEAGITEIVFPCQGGRFDKCIIRIRLGEPDNGVFGWDGNKESPTIKPSIGCDHRCGWHGHITNGEIEP